MLPEIERRTLGTIALRAEGDGEDAAKKKKLTGYAALFNVKSQELWGFKEVILPGAFDRALREAHDVRALLNHDPNFILGRTTAKTLDLAVDTKGLKVEIDPPDTTVGRDTVASVERGDLTQMSFAFRTLTDDWRMQDGEMIRELIDLELLDVSVVAYPAYEETGVQVSQRALDRAKAARQDASAAPIVEGAELRDMPDPNMPKVGDRVKVVVAPHMEGHDEGVVRQALHGALGIEFDSTPGEVHHWYVPSEVMVVPRSEEEPAPEPEEEQPMEMEEEGRSTARMALNREKLKLATS